MGQSVVFFFFFFLIFLFFFFLFLFCFALYFTNIFLFYRSFDDCPKTMGRGAGRGAVLWGSMVQLEDCTR